MVALLDGTSSRLSVVTSAVEVYISKVVASKGVVLSSIDGVVFEVVGRGDVAVCTGVVVGSVVTTGEV